MIAHLDSDNETECKSNFVGYSFSGASGVLAPVNSKVIFLIENLILVQIER